MTASSHPERGNGTRWASLLALALLLTGCDRMRFSWQGPDPVFTASDIDQDGELSREEWERMHGTSAADTAVVDFDRADCDRNGRLRGDEYFPLRFKDAHCQIAPLEVLERQAGRRVFAAAAVASLYSAKEVHLAQVSLVRNRHRLVRAKYHDDYSEQDMQPGTLYLYTLSCGGLEQVEIPEMSQDFRQISRLGLLEPGFHPAIRCTVNNRSGHTVTYLRLRLTVKAGEGEATAFHGKTLWIPPQDSRGLWVLPGAEQPLVAIDLLAVRHQAD